MWSLGGVLTDEGKYDKGDPVGVHHHFSENGSPLEKRVYYGPGRYDIKKWDEKGTLFFEGKYENSLCARYLPKQGKSNRPKQLIRDQDGSS